MSNRDKTTQPSAGEADALPMATLEWVWSSIGVRYGHYFAGKWDGFKISVVKEDWRYKLGGLTDRQLQHGLDNLPVGRPPADVGEFRAICLRAPEPTPQRALPRKRGPVEIPPEVRKDFDRLEKLRENEEPADVRAARASIALLEPRTVLSPVHKASLAAARRVVARHEARQAERAKEQAGAVLPAANAEH